MNLFRSFRRHSSPLSRFRNIAVIIPACAALNACGLVTDAEEYVVLVDSVSVAAPAQSGGAVQTTYFGDLRGSCAELAKVERDELEADTLQIRFIGRRESGSCIQAPSLLRYQDSIPGSPERTVHLLVRQPSGEPLRYDIAIPLAGTQ